MPLLDFAVSDEVQAGLDSVHGSVVLIAASCGPSKRRKHQKEELSNMN